MSAKHPHLAHHFEDLEQQHSAATLGMWTFLVTEVMIFGAVFIGYAVYRSAHPAEFAAGSAHLNIWLGAINTAVLLGSSLSMALAVQGAQVGNRTTQVVFLLLTLGLGSIFLGIKATEYYIDYREHLIPGLGFDDRPWKEAGLDAGQGKMFFVLYFVLTGLHAVHMLIGMGVLAVLTFLAWRGSFSAEYHTPIELSGLYWHFVDIVWIFLFPLLYLIGTHHFH